MPLQTPADIVGIHDKPSSPHKPDMFQVKQSFAGTSSIPKPDSTLNEEHLTDSPPSTHARHNHKQLPFTKMSTPHRVL